MRGPSPQRVKPPKRLNHLPSGTVGARSSQRANSFRSSVVIPRSALRRKRWRSTASGTSDLCIFGIGPLEWLPVEAGDEFLLQPGLFPDVSGIEAIRKFTKLISRHNLGR